MRNVKVVSIAALAVLVAIGCAGHKEPSLVPQPDVAIDAKLLSDFYDEVQDYVRLRLAASKMVPAVASGASAKDIEDHQRAIAAVIMKYRKGAKQGDIFKHAVSAAFRRILEREIRGPEGPAILGEIRSGNPKVEGVPGTNDPTHDVLRNVPLKVNALYPDGAPFSSMPPSLLLKLPQLPDQVRYRFVGRALILRDTEANVILDYIEDIVPDPTLPR